MIILRVRNERGMYSRRRHARNGDLARSQVLIIERLKTCLCRAIVSADAITGNKARKVIIASGERGFDEHARDVIRRCRCAV